MRSLSVPPPPSPPPSATTPASVGAGTPKSRTDSATVNAVTFFMPILSFQEHPQLHTTSPPNPSGLVAATTPLARFGDGRAWPPPLFYGRPDCSHRQTQAPRRQVPAKSDDDPLAKSPNTAASECRPT